MHLFITDEHERLLTNPLPTDQNREDTTLDSALAMISFTPDAINTVHRPNIRIHCNNNQKL